MIDVAIVEDDDEIRETLALLINTTDGFTCNATYSNAADAIEGITNELPDIVLMDIGLPGMNGIECIKVLKKNFPDLDVIVLTMHENDDYIFDSLCAGAIGYLLKEATPEKILDSIKEAINGGAPMSTQIARKVIGSFKVNPSPDLTKREREVLELLCEGKSYKMIANDLFISPETVRRHLKSIYRKLEVHSKSEAVSKAIKDRIV